MIEWLLRKIFPLKEIGWIELKEEFTRFQLLKTCWFNIYLHKLNAPIQHPHCHDHPWDFVAIILWNGYLETSKKGSFFRNPGNILWRPAEFRHNVVTNGTSWSLIITGPRKRKWRFITEEMANCDRA